MLQKISKACSKRSVNTVATAVSYKLKRFGDDSLESRPIYLDSSSTTPLDPRVMYEMMPFQISYYGNPHSTSHAYGWQAENAVENARQQVTDLIGAKSSKSIIFTSGATESNNIAIKGCARFYTRNSHKKYQMSVKTHYF